MADEVSGSFMLPGEPAANLASWRREPPGFLAASGYEQIDDSFESLVYEANVTTGFVKVTTFGFGKTIYRLTFTFRPVDGATQVSALGQALEPTRTAFSTWVVAHAERHRG
jgi:hypothetical protein